MTYSISKFPQIHSEIQGWNKQKRTMLVKGFISENNNIFVNNKTRLLSNIKSSQNGYIAELIFNGLNFSAKRTKRSSKYKSGFKPEYLLDLHKAEIFTIKESIIKPYQSRIFKRRLVFFSFNNKIIRNIVSLIKKLRLTNIYTGKGIYSRTDIYKTKSVKKKK